VVWVAALAKIAQAHSQRFQLAPVEGLGWQGRVFGQHVAEPGGTAADLLLVSPFTWFPKSAPDHPAVTAWIDRCEARPSARRTADFDAKHLEQIARA
jgi:hypothetical protein